MLATISELIGAVVASGEVAIEGDASADAFALGFVEALVAPQAITVTAMSARAMPAMARVLHLRRSFVVARVCAADGGREGSERSG